MKQRPKSYLEFEEDDEIPDEDANVSEIVNVHNSIVPRGSITGNISHSHTMSGQMPITKLSMSEISSGVTKRKNLLFSSQVSGLSSQK